MDRKLQQQITELRFTRTYEHSHGKDVTRIDRELAALESQLKAVTVRM